MDINSNYKILNELRCWTDCSNNLIFEKYLPGQNHAPTDDLFAVRKYLPLKEKEVKEILRKSMLNSEAFCDIILQCLKNEASICAKSLSTRSVIHLANQANNDMTQNDSFPFTRVDISIAPTSEAPNSENKEKRKKKLTDPNYIIRNGKSLVNLVDKCSNGPIPSLVSTLIMLYNKPAIPKSACLSLLYGDRKYNIGCSKALYRYCHKLKNHPEASIRETINTLLEGWILTRNHQVKHKIHLFLSGFTEVLTKAQSDNKEYKDKLVIAVKQCCPALFRYMATASLRMVFDKTQKLDVSTLDKNDPLTKIILHSKEHYLLDVIDNRLDKIWEKFKTNNYWKRQSALFDSVWAIYAKLNSDKTIFDSDFLIKTQADYKRLIEAFSTEAQPNRAVKSSATKKQPLRLAPPSEPTVNQPEVILEEPAPSSVPLIKSYHSRVKRWLAVSDAESVRSFWDGKEKEQPYAHCSPKELEMQVVDHGFSLAVDDLLKDSSYRIETDKGLGLVTQIIYPNGSMAMGMIQYGIDQGRCYHRHFNEKPLHVLLENSPSLRQQAMSPLPDSIDEEDDNEEYASKESIRINNDTGIATILDGRTGCTINVFKARR